MIYIEKVTPSREVSQELNRVKRDTGWENISADDKNKARSAFDQLDKRIIRAQLLDEQKGICAYCMRRITEQKHTSIEHWMPISDDATKALDYDNMLLCCDGGRNDVADGSDQTLCCDAAKDNRTIKISPFQKGQMEKIRYDRQGRIYVYPLDQDLQNDIDHILKLNGDVDSNGFFISDTRNRLRYYRKRAYQDCEVYYKRLNKRGKLRAAVLRKRLKEITQSKEYMEFVGVWIYLLKRKLKELP